MGFSHRMELRDGSFVDWQVKPIRSDRWRPHGVRYRLAWIQNGICRVLFDNHHGKKDHCHIDGIEQEYSFSGIDELWNDFFKTVNRLKGNT